MWIRLLWLIDRGLRLPEGHKYHFFLSHNQKEAGDIAHTLFEALTKMGLSIWYDMYAEDLTVGYGRRCSRVSVFLAHCHAARAHDSRFDGLAATEGGVDRLEHNMLIDRSTGRQKQPCFARGPSRSAM